MAVRYVTGSVTESGVPFGRAARELGLKAGELDLALQVGEVRAVVSGPAGPRRVRAEDIERHRSAEGFPDALRARLRTVGTAEGAELAGVATARFTRLARGGLLVPVRFWINRYGVVVWQYLASDVAEFAERRAPLLTGRLPADVRAVTDDGGDLRGARWRGLRVGQLEAQAGDPWQRAAAAAAVLSPDQLVPTVPDPAERAWIGALRPALTSVRPTAPAGRAAVEGVVFADGPDEVAHYQARVAASAAEARSGGAPVWPEAMAAGATTAAGPGAGAADEGARPLVPAPGAPRSAEGADRRPPPAPPSAGAPDAVAREQAATSRVGGGAALDPRPTGSTGCDAPGVGDSARPAATGGLRSVCRALDRLLGRGGRPGTPIRRERPAGRRRRAGDRHPDGWLRAA
ncbi:DUF6397 family protein, partial [Streptomyces huiliensis]|uniref:DUF6397 family protein n=1 Tax=Streptomyces huiliensis TaxID=2876027 RepID=UPI001CBB1015